MKLRTLSLLLCLFVFQSSCSRLTYSSLDRRAGIEPASDKKAPAQIGKSLNPVPPVSPKPTDTAKDSLSSDSTLDSSLLKTDRSHVSLKKAALGKEFLFSVNMLSQVPTPMFSSLQSRIVTFILRDSKVYLLDVTKNIQVGKNNIPQNLLLAEYPILQETETDLVIDFNQGMKSIFTASAMTGSDDSSGSAGAQYKLPLAKVNISYLDEVSLKEGALFIKQVAQLELAPADQTTTGKFEAQPMEVRYQIKPYLPDPTFEPTVSPGFDKVGYFEATPLLLPDGSTRIYAMKWNPHKKIKFALSANTPEKFRELFRNALLYWNKTLGEDVIEVTQLDDKTISAPTFDLNILQWVDWDTAGYAFADAHIDPRSGEVTSAQIFFPSAFMEANMAKRVRVLQASRSVQESKMRYGLKGFLTARVCERNLERDLLNSLVGGMILDENSEKSQEISQEALDKAIRDYIYEVIAHEMGHVLGLRHNFAGNLAANYDFQDRKKLITSYYQTQKAPEGIIGSNSVMEYSRFEESAWNGHRFQNGEPALSYDKMAMEFLYFKKDLPNENRPIFCTDSDISKYVDCNMSDAGRSIVSSALGAYQYNLKTLAAKIINLYIAQTQLAEDVGVDLIPVNRVNLNAKALAKTASLDLAKLVSLFKAGSHFISVRSNLMPQLNQNETETKELEKKYLQTEVERFSGINQILPMISDNFDTDLEQHFNLLIENPLYNSGTLRNGDKYSFSIEEKEFMKKQVQKIASVLKEELILNDLKIMSGQNYSFESTYGQSADENPVSWADSALSNPFADVLFQRFQNYVFLSNANKQTIDIKLKDGTSKNIELPIYKYSYPVRKVAAKLFSNDHEAIDWGYLQKQNSNELITTELSILGDIDLIDKSSLKPEVLKWYLENKEIENILP